MNHFQKLQKYGGEYVYCTCGRTLGFRYGDGSFNPSVVPNRVVANERLCVYCADERENMREMGYGKYKEPPKYDTMGKSVEEVRRMRRLEQLPIIRHDETTFLTNLERLDVLDAKWAVEIVTAYALASHDVNSWLDTLNNPAAESEERERALKRLKDTASEYQWLCEKREQVSAQIREASKK